MKKKARKKSNTFKNAVVGTICVIIAVIALIYLYLLITA